MEHPYPEMVAIWKANREHCTAAAIIEDGEVVSGSMPADDYRLAWLNPETVLLAAAHNQQKSKMPESNKWLRSNSPIHPLLR